MTTIRQWLSALGALAAGTLFVFMQYLRRSRDHYRKESERKARELSFADEHRQASERVQKAQNNQREENEANAKEQQEQRRSGSRPDRFGDRRL